MGLRDQDLTALLGVVKAFEALGIQYILGGSVASSFHGVARTTQDFDVVASLSPKNASELVALLGDTYYIDEESILEALRTGTSFNVIQQESFDKIDVFTRVGAWERLEFSRAVPVAVQEEGAVIVVSSPEDIVLRKLDWYRQGGGVSDRQWNDVLGVLKMQGEAFDREYAVDRAKDLDLSELLAKAFDEAG